MLSIGLPAILTIQGSQLKHGTRLICCCTAINRSLPVNVQTDQGFKRRTLRTSPLRPSNKKTISTQTTSLGYTVLEYHPRYPHGEL